MNKILTIIFVIFISNFALSQEPRYRFILPPRPLQPPALNNTVQTQIANQNINFNTNNNINVFSGGGFSGGGFSGGGFNANYGGIQGTIQYTQNNTPGIKISLLYQLPIATQFQNGFNQNGFNQNGFNQNGFNQNGFNQNNNMNGQPIGINNPFYQMAMQGITAGVSGSAFQSGSINNQTFRNNGFNQFNGNQFNNQFGFGVGFNNGGNGL